MLPKCARLKQKRDFTAIYKTARTYFTKPLKMLVLPDTSEHRSLVGFVVSKAVSKQAVKRNRVKRLLREAYQREMPSIKEGYLILFYARPRCIEADFSAICRLVNQLLLEAELYVA